MTSRYRPDAFLARQQREAKKRQRSLEKAVKQIEKLNALEKARLEVDQFENRLDLLLSIHKEASPTIDWMKLSASLPAPPPTTNKLQEFKAKIRAIADALNLDLPETMKTRGADELEQTLPSEEPGEYAQRRTECIALRELALNVLAGDHKAYTTVLENYGNFEEIAELGSSIHFSIHSSDVVLCSLKVNGVQAIPNEVKSLTAAGKLSVKNMPRARFQEIYHDYVCGCLLRLGREIFALLPIETVVITATAEDSTAPTETREYPILSSIFSRASFLRLDFDGLDPSDTIQSFHHRGDLSKARKTEGFKEIVPLTAEDVDAPVVILRYDQALSAVRNARAEILLVAESLKSSSSRPLAKP